MKIKFFLPLILLVSALISCSEKSSLLESLFFTNRAPDIPTVYSPANNSTGQSPDSALIWWCSDPDGDALTYDVYFGTNPTPAATVFKGLKANYLFQYYLSYNTTYYWKIVAKDSKGASTEGPVWKFRTGSQPNNAPSAPSNPSPADNLTSLQPTTVSLSWSCIDPDLDGLTYDVYFGTGSNPTSIVSPNQTAKNFTPLGLTTSTTYFWKIVAKDSKGATSEGPVWKFKTQATVTGYDFTFDGHLYKTVKIGTQVWTVENLRTTKYNDGTAITKINDNTTWSATINGAYCAYETTESNVATYGYLYNWNAVNTDKLAPTGWRVPTDADWTKLTDYVGGLATAGTKLKSTSGWYNGGNGSDNHEFSALASGYRISGGNFENLGKYGIWWSSTDRGSGSAWSRNMYYNHNYVDKSNYDYFYGFSVRLVRDL